MRRRRILVAAGVVAATALAGVLSRPSVEHELVAAARQSSNGGEPEARTEQILSGTDHETTLYEIDAPQDGPTAMIFGGVHGDEYNGIEIAHEIRREWQPDAGTLIVIPETDRIAVENEEREGIDGDLNRHFPQDGEPESELARGVWEVVERYDPDIVLDLHRSLGLYGVHDEFVGQAIFHSADAPGAEIASTLNDEVVPWYLPLHRFIANESHMSGPLLFQETARALDATSYLFETTSFLFNHETKDEMTRVMTAVLLERHGLLDAGENR
jgi:uncharacterized protein